MGIKATIQDYPVATTLATAVGVGVHWALYDHIGLLPDVAGAMAGFADAWQIYIGFAAVVAISAGFTGVVIVFALSSDSDRFRRLRVHGGERLWANWLSPVAVSLMAAFGATAVAVMAASGLGLHAWWAFEYLAVLSLASAFRLLWLLRELVKLVHLDDLAYENARANAEGAGVTLAEVLPHERQLQAEDAQHRPSG